MLIVNCPLLVKEIEEIEFSFVKRFANSENRTLFKKYVNKLTPFALLEAM